MFLKKVFIFLLKLCAVFTNKYYIEIIQNMTGLQNFTSIFVVFQKNTVQDLDVLFSGLSSEVNVPVQMFSIDIRHKRFSRHNDLLIIIADKLNFLSNSLYWSILGNNTLPKTKIIITPEVNILKILFEKRMYNTFILINGSSFEYTWFKNQSFSFSRSVQSFINTSRQNWPRTMILKVFSLYRDNPPLFMNILDNHVKTSGLILYFNKAFSDYINSKVESFNDADNLLHNMVLHIDARITFKQMIGYPLLKTDVCFMLPILDEFKPQEFLKKPYKLEVWIAIAGVIIYFTFSLRLLTNMDIMISFLESISISCGSVCVGVISKATRIRLVYILLFVYGFIVWNQHNSILSSYLTTPNKGQKIDTLKKIKETGIKVWYNVDDRSYKNMYLIIPKIAAYRIHHLKKQFSSILYNKFYNNLKIYNTSQGYMIPEFMWNTFKYAQLLLKRKLFSYTNICPTCGFVYPINPDVESPDMEEMFSYFTIRAQECGLTYIWTQFTYYDVKFKFLRMEIRSWKVIGFKFFEVTWWIGGVGMILSLVVFAAEIAIFKVCNVKLFRNISFKFY